jgi:hypothetical protein
MSMPIRHPLKGEPHPESGSLAAPAAGAFATRAEKTAGWVLAARDWARRSLGSDRGKREPRSLFQTWAASDLAHRDAASQMWPTLAPR